MQNAVSGRTNRCCHPAILACAIAATLIVGAVQAQAQAPVGSAQTSFDIPAQPAGEALNAFARQSGWRILFPFDAVEGKRSRAIRGAMSNEAALNRLLEDTGLIVASREDRVITLCVGEDGRCVEGQQGNRQSGTQTTPSLSEVSELGTIIVTARKRDERQIDVPIAMTTVTGEQVDEFGLKNVDDIVNITPGASSSVGGIQIRGVSTSLGGNENGYYVNETPFTGVTVPWYPDVRSFDIDRVEILKGPQGTLFGEGSMGGTVRIITRKPQFNAFSAGAEVDFSTTSGGADAHGAKVYANVPLIDDRLAFRIVATDEETAGWIDDAATGKRDVNGTDIRTHRAALRFQPKNNWTIDALYWKFDAGSEASGVYAYNDMTYDSFSNSANGWNSTSLTSTYDFAGSQLVYALSDGEIENVQGGELSPGLRFDYSTAVGVTTHELRWASTGERTFDWTVGVYSRKASREDVLDIPAFAIYSNSSQGNDGYALFGETTMRINSRWSLTTGLRYFSDKVSAVEVVESGEQSSIDTRFDSWNPRLSLSYKPSRDVTLYASAARGFRSGQLQPISAIQLAELYGIELPSEISPDSIWTYELGAKSIHLDGRLMLEGALFHSEWKDVAVRVPIENLFNGLMNSEGTKTRGAEASIAYNPNTSLMLQFGASYTDASYSSDVPGTTFREGAQALNVPKLGANVLALYRWDVGERLRGTVAVNVHHESPRRTVVLEGGRSGDAATQLSLKTGIESPSGWSAYLYGQNLTNESAAVSPRDPDVFDAEGNFLFHGAAVRLKPRTFGVLIRYDY